MCFSVSGFLVVSEIESEIIFHASTYNLLSTHLLEGETPSTTIFVCAYNVQSLLKIKNV